MYLNNLSLRMSQYTLKYFIQQLLIFILDIFFSEYRLFYSNSLKETNMATKGKSEWNLCFL